MDGLANIIDQPARYCLRDGLKRGVERLAAAGIDSPRLDAEVLLAHCLGLTREQLILRADSPMTSAAAAKFESLLRRRLEREPVAYIIGKQEFWSLEFAVTPDVLIPRPETERLVEVALVEAAKISSADSLRIADLGTGSGALAVSLATELPTAKFCATDVSFGALQIARANAERYRVAERIEFCPGDLFAALARQVLLFDLIVSNPPYVRRADLTTLAPEVRQEPSLALDGGADGYDFYRRIAAAAPAFLTGQGALIVEIGADQARAVENIFRATEYYRELELLQDYAGRDRVVLARVKQN